MKFTSRPEAYLYALYLLENISAKDRVAIGNCESIIASIQICIENHEQDPGKVAALVDAALVQTSDDKEKLCMLSAALKDSASYQALSPYEKWKAPLARRVESALAIELLTNPTAKMMHAIHKASQKIINIIHSLDKDTEDKFLSLLYSANLRAISLGSFRQKVTKEVVIALLESNSNKQLTEILFVHLQFSSYIARINEVIGSRADIAKNISNERMYRSSYYRDRGRQGSLSAVYTSKMGLDASPYSIFSTGFPEHASSLWIADAKAQSPNLESFYVNALINHDTPYIAGASGMTSIFVGGMYALNALSTIEERRLYLVGFASYIVAGGFHSLHEVLGPIAYCLPEEKLIEGYATCIPNASTDIPSPLYHAFYSLIAAIDDEFLLRREDAWRKTRSFFKDFYLPSVCYLNCYDELNKKTVILDVINEYETVHRNSLFSSALPLINFYKAAIAATDNAYDLWAITEDFLNEVEFSEVSLRIAKCFGCVSRDDLMGRIINERQRLRLQADLSPDVIYENMPLTPRNLSL